MNESLATSLFVVFLKQFATHAISSHRANCKMKKTLKLAIKEFPQTRLILNPHAQRFDQMNINFKLSARFAGSSASLLHKLDVFVSKQNEFSFCCQLINSEQQKNLNDTKLQLQMLFNYFTSAQLFLAMLVDDKSMQMTVVDNVNWIREYNVRSSLVIISCEVMDAVQSIYSRYLSYKFWNQGVGDFFR